MYLVVLCQILMYLLLVMSKLAMQVLLHANYLPWSMNHCSRKVSWINKTAKACIIVSTLIFSACYSWLTGNNNDDNKGSQNDSKRLASQIFALADTVALMSSLASVSIFFSTVISRFSEEDF
ncbi:hypothetical protein HN51_058217 [Arachis hypogaea]